MMKIKMKKMGIIVCFLLSCSVLSGYAQDGFTQADRDRLTRLETIYTVFSQQVDKRLDQVDKRFEELRTDMNKRFEELRADMNARFEQVDKRFEQVDKRFEQTTDMFYTLAAIFTSLFVAVFGFAWWDRRSILITAKKAAREEVEESTRGSQDGNYRLSEK